MSIIVCDSAADLWNEQIKEWDINIIKIPYFIDGVIQEQSLISGEDFDNYYQQLRDGKNPSTLALGEKQLEKYFDGLLKTGEDILFVHMSGKLTKMYERLPKVVDKLLVKYPKQKFLTVDSLQVSMGEGILVYQAAKLLKKGIELEKIKEELDKLKYQITSYFWVNDISYLRRDGRLSSSALTGGSMLGVKHILKCDENGKIAKYATAKSDKELITKISSLISDYGNNAGEFPIVITHSGNEKNAKLLQDAVYKLVGEDTNVWIQPIGPVVGTHSGPDSVMLIFRAKHR